MIYRGWSLITGPAVMVGGVAGALLAFDYLVKQIQEPYAKPPQRKQDSGSSSK